MKMILFPLNTVLFPEGILPLRIFEPRYLRMVRECLERDEGFGVFLIRQGREVGAVADIHEVGTVARIRDFEQLPDGLLGITAVGEKRIRYHDLSHADDRLLSGDVEYLPDVETPIPDELQGLEQVFRQLLSLHSVAQTPQLEQRMHEATWLGWRLAELLPLSLQQRQQLLEENDPRSRLRMLESFQVAQQV